MDRLEESLARPRYDRKATKPLTDEDYDDFDRAGNIRQKRHVTPRNIAEVKKQLKRDNLVRYMRLQSDVRWARKRLRKMGRNPDDLWTVLGG
jgi:hypothetical protein